MQDKISEILTRGVEEVIDHAHLEKALRSKAKLRVKLGIDPTSKNIHIGRAVSLWKLRALQDLGHKIVIIIGDFTGLVGDTSDKDSERPMLTKAEVKQNMKDYVGQVGKIINLKKAETHFNSKWLAKLNFLEIAEQADQFSLHEFEARENIAKRMKDQKRVSLRELLYPLMQGYDSVAIKANLEVGGTDQRFNLLAGRTLQKFYKQEPQDIMTFTLLEGTDGRKMSSSWGNVINISDSPENIFGKTMSILDSLIVKYYTVATNLPLEQVKEIENGLKSGKVNPRNAKFELAKQLVALYHGKKAADSAAEQFERVHRHHELPEKVEQRSLAGMPLSSALVASGAASSSSAAYRVIEQGGVQINGVKVKDPKRILKKGEVLKKGKNFFVQAK